MRRPGAVCSPKEGYPLRQPTADTSPKGRGYPLSLAFARQLPQRGSLPLPLGEVARRRGSPKRARELWGFAATGFPEASLRALGVHGNGVSRSELVSFGGSRRRGSLKRARELWGFTAIAVTERATPQPSASKANRQIAFPRLFYTWRANSAKGLYGFPFCIHRRTEAACAPRLRYRRDRSAPI